MRVGIIGCGNISDIYVRNAKLFKDVEIIACADILPPAAERLARKYSLREMKVEALLAADDIEIILNLTLPTAHADVPELRSLRENTSIARSRWRPPCRMPLR